MKLEAEELQKLFGMAKPKMADTLTDVLKAEHRKSIIVVHKPLLHGHVLYKEVHHGRVAILF